MQVRKWFDSFFLYWQSFCFFAQSSSNKDCSMYCKPNEHEEELKANGREGLALSFSSHLISLFLHHLLSVSFIYRFFFSFLVV